LSVYQGIAMIKLSKNCFIFNVLSEKCITSNKSIKVGSLLQLAQVHILIMSQNHLYYSTTSLPGDLSLNQAVFTCLSKCIKGNYA